MDQTTIKELIRCYLTTDTLQVCKLIAQLQLWARLRHNGALALPRGGWNRIPGKILAKVFAPYKI